jgi:hypothetical protein
MEIPILFNYDNARPKNRGDLWTTSHKKQAEKLWLKKIQEVFIPVN